MRILHIIPSISGLRGGPSAAVLDMVAALRGQGVDACILTTNDHGPGVDHTMPLGRWFERDGLPVLAFGRWSPPLAALREYAISPGLNRWLASHLQHFDLLHVHAIFSWPSSSAMLQARQRRVPYVLSTIGQLNRWSLRRSRLRKRLMLRLLDRANLAAAARLHFASQAELEEAADLQLPARPLVLPLGVTLPHGLPSPQPRPAAAPTQFLFLSRIHPKKQLETLLAALSLLHQQRPTAAWFLSIAGTGDPAYLAELHRQATEGGIADRLHWLGYLAGEAKWRALVDADWFVLPSASENFGIAAIESLAAGTPVILSPAVAVAAEITAAGAGLTVAAQPAALASALEAALGGPAAAMRCAARALADQHYSWPAIGANLRQAYDDILRGRS